MADDDGVIEFGFDDANEPVTKQPAERKAHENFRARESKSNKFARITRDETDKILAGADGGTAHVVDLAVYTQLVLLEEVPAKGTKSKKGWQRGPGCSRLGYARTSSRKLAEQLGVGASMIKESLARLERKKLVRLIETPGRTVPVYLILTDLVAGHAASFDLKPGRVDGQVAGQVAGHRQHPRLYEVCEEELSSEDSPPSVVVPLRTKSPPVRGGRRLAAARTRAGGASRRAAAATAAPSSPSLTNRTTWESILGVDHFAWEESDSAIAIETKMFYTEDDAKRVLVIRWRVGKLTNTALVGFPNSKGIKAAFPWQQVIDTSDSTWQEFAGSDHGYSTFDFIVCLEDLTYMFASKGKEIESPVGFIGLVSADILSRHRWGGCGFKDFRFAKPKKEQTK